MALNGLCFLEDEEERACHVEGQEAQHEKDGDDGFDGLAAPVEVRCVLRAGDGHRCLVFDPFVPAAHSPLPLAPVAGSEASERLSTPPVSNTMQ